VSGLSRRAQWPAAVSRRAVRGRAERRRKYGFGRHRLWPESSAAAAAAAAVAVVVPVIIIL